MERVQPTLCAAALCCVQRFHCHNVAGGPKTGPRARNITLDQKIRNTYLSLRERLIIIGSAYITIYYHLLPLSASARFSSFELFGSTVRLLRLWWTQTCSEEELWCMISFGGVAASEASQKKKKRPLFCFLMDRPQGIICMCVYSDFFSFLHIRAAVMEVCKDVCCT